VIAVTVRRRNQQQELGGCGRQYEQPGDSIPPTTHVWADSISPASQQTESVNACLFLSRARAHAGGTQHRDRHEVSADGQLQVALRRGAMSAPRIPTASRSCRHTQKRPARCQPRRS
jgi:hypothetical protein